MHNLKSTSLAVPGGGEMTLVATLALQCQVLESNVANLKDLHGHTVCLVLADGLQQSREQTSADNLELNGFRVGQSDGSVAVVLAVQPSEVLFMGAKDKREHLGPASHGGFHANDIGELVDGKGLSNGSRLAGERTRKRVETISNGNILHDIALVENVGARRGDVDIDEVRVISRWLGVVCHLLQVGTDLGSGEVQATALVDVGHFRLGSARLDVRSDAGLAVVFRHNLDRLNSISRVSEYTRCLVVSGSPLT